MYRRRKRQNQGYSVRENKAFKKGMHFGWNKHKKMIRDLRTCKRQLKKRPRKSKSMKLRKIYINKSTSFNNRRRNKFYTRFLKGRSS